MMKEKNVEKEKTEIAIDGSLEMDGFVSIVRLAEELN